MNYINHEEIAKRAKGRLMVNSLFKTLSLLATLFGVLMLALLLFRVFSDGIAYINWDFLTGRLSTAPERAGILGAILGSLWLILVVTPVMMLIGIGTAVFIELYMKDGKFRSLISLNIKNLAGVPSIVYGILGLAIFVRALNLGSVVLAGGLTIALLVLPISIVATQEALRAIPMDLSDGALGVGATKWQAIRTITLPAALPSILTGAILALSRAIGETAPLVVIGIPTLLLPFPGGIFDKFTVLPMQIYYWTLDSVLVAEYANLAAATIIVLLVILFALNFIAITLRRKYEISY